MKEIKNEKSNNQIWYETKKLIPPPNCAIMVKCSGSSYEHPTYGGYILAHYADKIEELPEQWRFLTKKEEKIHMNVISSHRKLINEVFKMHLSENEKKIATEELDEPLNLRNTYYEIKKISEILHSKNEVKISDDKQDIIISKKIKTEFLKFTLFIEDKLYSRLK